MHTVATFGLALIVILVWSVLAPLAIAALRRWAYSLNRPWLGSAIAFVVTLALYSLFVAVWMWWGHMTMADAVNARAYMFGVAVGEGTALLISAIIAGAFFRMLNARRHRAIPASPTEPR